MPSHLEKVCEAVARGSPFDAVLKVHPLASATVLWSSGAVWFCLLWRDPRHTRLAGCVYSDADPQRKVGGKEVLPVLEHLALQSILHKDWDVCLGSLMMGKNCIHGPEMCSSGRCPCPLKGVWNEVIFKVPPNSSHSVMFCAVLKLIAKRTRQSPIFLQLLLATVLYRSEMSQDMEISGALSPLLAGVGPSCPLSSACVGTGCTDLNFRGFIFQLQPTPAPAAACPAVIYFVLCQGASLNLRFSFYFVEMPTWRVPELVCTVFYETQLPNKINKSLRSLGVVLRYSVAWVY